MTEGLHDQHAKPMCVRIWLEVGHSCSPRRSALGRALALDWRLWVRGAFGQDISTFVHKVVFYLHPSSAYVYPKRVLQEPPYEIQESGNVSLDVPIHVYLKHSIKPKKIRIKYGLAIENHLKSSSESRCLYYDVENPPEQLWRALVHGGGEVVARAASCAGRVLVLPAANTATATPPSQLTERRARHLRHNFVEPFHCKHMRKPTKPYLFDEICLKCTDFKKQLRSVAMTDDEIQRVSQLYIAVSSYEKSGDAIVLPPLTDSIYQVPELPASLRRAFKRAQIEFNT